MGNEAFKAALSYAIDRGEINSDSPVDQSLSVYLIRKIAEFVASSAFIKPYSPSKNGPSYKRPETLYTSLKGVFRGEDHLRFFDHRFIAIWVLPIALTGIVFEVLFITPTKNSFPFN